MTLLRDVVCCEACIWWCREEHASLNGVKQTNKEFGHKQECIYL